MLSRPPLHHSYSSIGSLLIIVPANCSGARVLINADLTDEAVLVIVVRLRLDTVSLKIG